MPASKAQAEAMPAATEKDDVAVWIPCSCSSLCPVRASLCHALAMSAQRPQKPKQLHTYTHTCHTCNGEAAMCAATVMANRMQGGCQGD